MLRLLLPLLMVVAFPLASLAQKPDLDKLLDKKTFTSGKATLSYRLLKPAKVEKDETYPLVIFLHGAGERGDDNTAQLKHGVGSFASEARRKKSPCFLIAPQVPRNRSWVEGGKTKKGDGKGDASRQASEPGKLVLELIEQSCKDLPIDKKRIYLTGLSMGGYGTWGLLARKPELFAAGIPICGGGSPASAEKLTKIPIWVFHGDKDTAVPVARSREMIEAIKKAGGSPKYTEYPGVGHDSWTKTYADNKVLDWLFDQKKN